MACYLLAQACSSLLAYGSSLIELYLHSDKYLAYSLSRLIAAFTPRKRGSCQAEPLHKQAKKHTLATCIMSWCWQNDFNSYANLMLAITKHRRRMSSLEQQLGPGPNKEGRGLSLHHRAIFNFSRGFNHSDRGAMLALLSFPWRWIYPLWSDDTRISSAIKHPSQSICSTILAFEHPECSTVQHPAMKFIA